MKKKIGFLTMIVCLICFFVFVGCTSTSTNTSVPAEIPLSQKVIDQNIEITNNVDRIEGMINIHSRIIERPKGFSLIEYSNFINEESNKVADAGYSNIIILITTLSPHGKPITRIEVSYWE